MYVVCLLALNSNLPSQKVIILKNAFSPLYTLTHTDLSLKQLMEEYNKLQFEAVHSTV